MIRSLSFLIFSDDLCFVDLFELHVDKIKVVQKILKILILITCYVDILETWILGQFQLFFNRRLL